MATFALIHGGGADSTCWRPLTGALERLGHDVVAVDLPNDDDTADLSAYADAVVTAVAGRRDVIVVAHSYGGFTTPIVAERTHAALLVMLQAQIPAPGESPAQWWGNTGHDKAQRQHAEAAGRDPDSSMDTVELMLHDTPPELAEEMLSHEHGESPIVYEQPWPLPAWPDIPTRVLLSRDDNFFPLEFMRRIAWERLGIEPDVVPGDHCPMLGHPVEVAAKLDAYWRELTGNLN